MRIALVHEFLVQHGGAERVLDAFHELYPEAPIYTSVYDKRAMGGRYASADVRTSSLQRLYGNERRYKYALSRFAGAFEEFDFREFDIVISSSWGFAKGVVTPPGTSHICYCHTPSRLAWQFDSYVGAAKMGGLLTRVLRRQANAIREWDFTSSARVDHFIANSKNVAERIQKYYRRTSSIVYPPVETTRFSISSDPPEDFFLLVGRMIPYKRMDVAVEAFSRMGKPLKIIGRGPQEKELRAMAGPTVEFLGPVSDAESTAAFSRCRALIATGEEDFGIIPLEAMASGRPVIAYGAGGALETVQDGITGVLYEQQRSSSLIQAVKRFETYCFSPQVLRETAEQFDTSRFKREVAAFVAKVASPQPEPMYQMAPLAQA